MFSSDVMAVLDVAAHPRPSRIVSKEGKGLDLAIEVIVLGRRRTSESSSRRRDLLARRTDGFCEGRSSDYAFESRRWP